MFWVILVYALFASVFTVGKSALEYTSPYFLVGSRMFAAGIILLGYQALYKRESLKITWAQLKPLIMLAFFTIYLTNVLEFWGLQYLTTFKTCFIYSLSPFFSALLAYLMLNEKLNLKKWAGLLIGFLGFIPILLTTSVKEDQLGQLGIFSWPELAVIGAALSSVYGWILLKKIVTKTEGGSSPVMANGYSMLIGGGFALIHSYFVEPWNPLPVSDLLPFLSYALILIMVSNLICYNLYGYLLKKFSATFMSFAGFTTPLFTALYGWLFLGEVVTWPFYLSFVIVLLGLTLFNSEELPATQLELKSS